MAYKITEKCISCGACAGECPVGCISQGDEKYIIDNNSCIGCGACARQCPANCITGERKMRHVIDQKKCLKCGACETTCKFNAIEKK